MTIEKIVLFVIGFFLIFLSVRSFIFLFKGGGFEVGMSSVGTRNLKPKNHASKGDQTNLILHAVLFLILGIVLIYTNFP